MKLNKRILSAFMAAVILFSFASLYISAESADENLPVVFVGGKGTTLIDKDKNVIFPRAFDAVGIVKKVLPSLTKGNLTNDFSEFCDDLYDAVAEQYKDLPLDSNGNASNGTNTDFKWTKTSLSWSVRKDEPYRIYDYCFYYDWRVDPCETADKLNEYINDVLEVTHAPKVRIIGRCMGSNIVLAYLNEYGCEKVERCLFYVSTINGVSGCGAGFSGDFEIDRKAAARFAQDLGIDPVFTLGENTSLNDLVGSLVRALRDTGGVDLGIWAVKNVYDKVEENVVPRLLRATYATFPAYWSMIGDDYYDDAKKCAFAGKEEEYAGLIAKIDNYHYNIQVKAMDILKRLESEGLDISVVCKYGVQQVPISREYNMLSDNTVELYRSSFGAICTDLFETFDDAYLKNATLRGAEKHISPDKQVDCSTCLFPENTWVIKNCTHTDFPKCVDEMMMTIIRYPGRMTVNDNENYPQYLVYDNEADTIVPMTEENCNTTERWEETFFEAVANVVRIIIEIIFASANAE